MVNKIKTILNQSRKIVFKNPRLSIVAIIGILGFSSLLISHAASAFFVIEPENDQLNGSQQFSDPGASSGSAIIFGSADNTANKTCNNVSQYGVVYSFDKQYPCGQFANGDYWVTPTSSNGSVKIISITPNASGGRNGWMVNPTTTKEGGPGQAYDNRTSNNRGANAMPDYDPSKMPTLPYEAKANQSIVKAISEPSSKHCGENPPAGESKNSCLATATVLTVLESAPPNNGADSFRPTYVGSIKKLYSVSQLKTDLLPSLSPVSSTPSLDSIKNRFQRLQLDHFTHWKGQFAHPTLNFSGNYGSDIAASNNDAAFRLMLNDPIEQKMPALINYVQAGIDWYGSVAYADVQYFPDGGHFIGRKLPVVFAAIMLDDSEMKNFVKTHVINQGYHTSLFDEDGHVYYSPQAGRALFGQDCNPGVYQDYLDGKGGSKDCRDPSGQVDGSGYQFCCTTQTIKASSLAARLLPGAREIWNYEPFFEYADRMASYGPWPQGKSTHTGSLFEDGYHVTSFMNNMWNTYRPTVD